MIGELNHVAIATANLEAASKLYRDVLANAAKVSAPQPLPEHGVTTVFIDTGNTKLELLEPLGEDSPIAQFIERNPAGGIHHLCFEVDDLSSAIGKLRAEGYRVLGDPKIGAHGLPVVFLHPKDFGGVLLELEEKAH